MTYFTSFLLKLRENKSVSRTLRRQWGAVLFEVLLEDDNSLASLLGLGDFGLEIEAWGKEEGWIIWYFPDMKCRQSQDLDLDPAPLDLGICKMRFC